MKFDYKKYNQIYWDRIGPKELNNHKHWLDDAIARSKNGQLDIYVSPYKSIPHHFLQNIPSDSEILVVGGAGGYQVPILASAGHRITSLDISEEQLNLDKRACEKHNLSIKTIVGDMEHLDSLVEKNKFDLIINPPSLNFIENLEQVIQNFKNCLKPNGLVISGIMHSFLQQVNIEEYKKDNIVLEKKSENKIQNSIENGLPIEFPHSLENILTAFIKNDLNLIHFEEDNWGKELNEKIDKYLDSFIIIVAEKLQPKDEDYE